MTFTKEKITELVTQILNDLGLEYYKDEPFVILMKEEQSYYDKKHNIMKPWVCSVSGPDYQFGGTDGGYAFTIDDDPPHTIFFQDASGGQVPNALILKDESKKYYRKYLMR